MYQPKFDMMYVNWPNEEKSIKLKPTIYLSFYG